ncbi:MAG: 16S rRNA methyltransferase [Candidatus Hadarchaeota archaeon]
MLHLVIADAELEQVPREIAGHPAIQRSARRRGRKPTELILNSSLHYPAMKKLKDQERRGRPDIIHFSLLMALDTPLNREGLLKVYVHTRQNKLITVNPSADLPKMYGRFEGLFEQLFLTGAVPPEAPLLHLENGTLSEAIQKINPKKVMVLSEKGERKRTEDIFDGVAADEDVCVVVGGFPHGDYLSDVRKLSDEFVSIDPEALTVPTVVSRLVQAYEERFGVQGRRLQR